MPSEDLNKNSELRENEVKAQDLVNLEQLKKQKAKEDAVKKAKQKRKEAKDKEKLILNKVEDSKKKFSLSVIEYNKKLNKVKNELDDFIQYLDSSDFTEHDNAKKKVLAIKRLLNATKMGIERQKIKHYDVDTYMLQEKFKKEVM